MCKAPTKSSDEVDWVVASGLLIEAFPGARAVEVAGRADAAAVTFDHTGKAMRRSARFIPVEWLTH